MSNVEELVHPWKAFKLKRKLLIKKLKILSFNLNKPLVRMAPVISAQKNNDLMCSTKETLNAHIPISS